MLIIKESDPKSIDQAVQILKSGGVISFATETVYALACDAKNDCAIRKLYDIKKRDPKKPISVMVKDLKTANNIFLFSDLEKKVANSLMPGAITLILKKRDDFFISKLLNNGSDEVGLRIANHEFSLKLLREFSGVICATSANISNQKDSLNSKQVLEYFGNQIDLIIDGKCDQKTPSTVLKIDQEGKVQIIRQGLISKNIIENGLTKKSDS